MMVFLFGYPAGGHSGCDPFPVVGVISKGCATNTHPSIHVLNYPLRNAPDLFHVFWCLLCPGADLPLFYLAALFHLIIKPLGLNPQG